MIAMGLQENRPPAQKGYQLIMLGPAHPRPQRRSASNISEDDRESKECNKIGNKNDIRTQHNVDQGSLTTVNFTNLSIC